MDEVDLPVMPAGMTLKDALAHLRREGLSGLVIDAKGERTVLDAALLLGRGLPGGTKLGEIEIPRRSITLPARLRSMSHSAASRLDADGASFGIGEVRSGRASIFTRHEVFANALRMRISCCICEGPLEHVWGPGDLTTPGQCNLDSYRVECD